MQPIIQTIHTLMMNATGTSNVDGCWNLTVGRHGSIYGRINHLGRSYFTHRLMYQLFHAITLTPDQFVCHKCDNPTCINPKHLFLGDAILNAQDMASKGRNNQSKKTHCPSGHEYAGPNLILTRSGERVCRTCRKLKRDRS